MDSLIHSHGEIMMDILSRLPLRFLSQCNCVSKSWKTIISDPYLKRKHLNRAKNKLTYRKFIGSQLYLNADNMLSFDCSSISSTELVEYVQKLDCPAIGKPCPCRIYCCLDGLALIGVRYDKHLALVLWNPTTKESVLLPCPKFPAKEFSAFGLGYDSTSDDYKILKIDPKIRAEILALKSGSWRKIDKHPTAIHPVLSGMDPVAFVHGAFHWLGSSLDDSVVSFSISNEKYGEIPLPDRMCLNSNKACIERGISILEGKLCAYYIGNYEGKDSFCVSVMEDYGIKESWRGVIVINGDNICSAILYYKFADAEQLICCTSDNKRFYSAFRTSRGPFGICPQRKSFREGFVFTESYISPKLHNA